MSIKIQAKGFRLTSSIKSYVNSKLNKILERYRGQLPNIEVKLLDDHGPRGGEDMRCRILFKPAGLRPIIIQETAEDLYDAISACCHRAKWTANRYFQREQSIQRHVEHRSWAYGELAYIPIEESNNVSHIRSLRLENDHY
jgi:putative sigma-54 modulation protein